MRWQSCAWVLLFMSGLAFAAVEQVGKQPQRIYREAVSDTSVDGATCQYHAVSRVGSYSIFADTDGRTRSYIYPGWTATITHEEMVLGEAHADATENCLVTLEYSADATGTTGTTVTGSGMKTNETSPLFNCDGVGLDLDTQGEGCRQRIGPLTLIGPAWLHWKVCDGGGNGVGDSCTSLDAHLSVFGTRSRG